MSKNNKPVAGNTPTTQKIAFQTGAAKDELFASALNEDQGFVTLNVLANDPGSAKLYSLAQGITSSSTQVQVLGTATLASGAVISIDNGVVRYDISNVNYQGLAQGQIAVDTFEYVIQMGNGALSIATASVQVVGLNDAPTLAALPLSPVVIEDTSGPESATSVQGKLEGSDVDQGAILTYGFAASECIVENADGTVSLTNDYGTLTLNSTTGDYTFVVNAQALDALGAEDAVSVGFDVLVRDEHGAVSNIETIKFELFGADEAPVVTNPVTEFNINHGQGFINDRRVIDNFDNNDQIKVNGGKWNDKIGVYSIDYNGDGVDDSSAFMVVFNGTNHAAEIVLTGYLGLTEAQFV